LEQKEQENAHDDAMQDASPRAAVPKSLPHPIASDPYPCDARRPAAIEEKDKNRWKR